MTPGSPLPRRAAGISGNGQWRQLNNHEVILMPDPWEYPWFAAWDLAFHSVTLAHIDPEFAKSQLVLLQTLMAAQACTGGLTSEKFHS